MNSLYDYFMQQFQDAEKLGMKLPEMQAGIKPVDVAQPDEHKDLLSRIAAMNDNNRSGGGILDLLGYTDNQVGRSGGFLDKYNQGQGIFSLLK
jgi:hypothetical protein